MDPRPIVDRQICRQPRAHTHGSATRIALHPVLHPISHRMAVSFASISHPSRRISEHLIRARGLHPRPRLDIPPSPPPLRLDKISDQPSIKPSWSYPLWWQWIESIKSWIRESKFIELTMSAYCNWLLYRSQDPDAILSLKSNGTRNDALSPK